MNDKPLATSTEAPTAIHTGYMREIADRRDSPAARNADIVEDARNKMDAYRRQREQFEARRTVAIDHVRALFNHREEQRQRTIESARKMIADAQAAGLKDADDMRSQIKRVETEAGDEIASIDAALKALTTLVNDLSPK